jgi:hypothetical protein
LLRFLSSADISKRLWSSRLVGGKILFRKVSEKRILGNVSAEMLSTEGIKTSE